MTPPSASRHYRRIQRLAAISIAAARRAWRRMDPARNWQQQYEEPQGVGAQLVALTAAAQMAAAQESDSYVADVLNDLAFGPRTRPGVIRPAGFVGSTGDGRPVETLLAHAVVEAGQAYNAAPPTMPQPEQAAQALETAEQFLDRIVHEIVAETARAAESAATAQREWVEGWVRMVNPPACSRCILLAGKFYLWNEGFERHPMCDCTHIPASEAVAGDLTIDPDAYFHSLDESEQDRIFTKAGAQAIRDGADISQVINARRGMKRAQVFGQDVLITDEGATRRGFAYTRLTTGRRNDTRRRGERVARAANVRLMPESIYAAAKDRADAIRLLKLHGFIF